MSQLRAFALATAIALLGSACAPRPGEVHGEHYYFLTLDEFTQRLPHRAACRHLVQHRLFLRPAVEIHFEVGGVIVAGTEGGEFAYGFQQFPAGLAPDLLFTLNVIPSIIPTGPMRASCICMPSSSSPTW